MELREVFATNLRRWRNARGLSQDDLAYEAGSEPQLPIASLKKVRYYARLENRRPACGGRSTLSRPSLLRVPTAKKTVSKRFAAQTPRPLAEFRRPIGASFAPDLAPTIIRYETAISKPAAGGLYLASGEAQK